MSKKINVDDLPEFDMAAYLKTPKDIANYLTVVLEENDAGSLADALGTIARARGMNQIAEDSGLTREALYKALKPGTKPRVDTITKVCAALGVKLVAKPIGRSKAAA